MDQSEEDPDGQSGPWEPGAWPDGLGQSGPWDPRAWPEGRQVLTHLVEGFVIQEGLQPFPVNRSSLLVSGPQELNGTNGVPPEPQKPQKPPPDPEEEEEPTGGGAASQASGSAHRTVLHCQFCGKRGHAHNFMRSKRFCSTSCARGFNVRLTKRLRALSAGARVERSRAELPRSEVSRAEGMPRAELSRAESVPGRPLLLRLPRDLWSAGRREKEKKPPGDEEEKEEEDEDEEEEEEEEEEEAVAMATRMERRPARRPRRASAPAGPSRATPTSTYRPPPAQWSVEEVTAFISSLPGLGEVSEAFRLQEIDGQALLLLTEDHLMSSMSLKLGPALKICAHINALRHQ